MSKKRRIFMRGRFAQGGAARKGLMGLGLALLALLVLLTLGGCVSSATQWAPPM